MCATAPKLTARTNLSKMSNAEGTRHLVLGILPLLRSSIYPRSLSMYFTMAVVVPKPNHQLPIHCTSVNKLIICRCQQPSSVAVHNHLLSLSTNISCRCQQSSSVTVNKLFSCHRSLHQSNSNKHLSKNGRNEAKKCFKGNYIPTLCFVLCIVCCVLCVVYHSTVL